MEGYRLFDIAGEVLAHHEEESSGNRARHSSMVRRGGSGLWSTATGRASDSMTTSSPARTRASSAAIAGSFGLGDTIRRHS